MPGSAAPAVPLTELIGRDREVSEVRSLLGSARLVTLTGTGGTGKTRVALELFRAPGSLPERRGWVDLASLTEPGRIAQQIVRSLGVAEEVPPGDVDRLLSLLGVVPLFLVLDNCEHLVEECARLCEVLLAGHADLRILATSREPLGLQGERVWLVPPLDLPAANADLAMAERSHAVRLFRDRARDVVADFSLTPGNVGAVAEICRRLDGLPLAIELAAARVRVLSVEQIRRGLDDVFRTLGAGARTVVPRHRTLAAAVGWSDDLLPEEGRMLLRRLSVFRGGFTLDGAAAVGRAGDESDSGSVLDQVARLVDRSLVQVRELDGMARYSLLETIRQYGEARLRQTEEEQEVRARHARFLAGEVARAAPELTSPKRRQLVPALLLENDNLREALAWSRDHAASEHVAMVGGLWWFWYSTRFWLEAGEWIAGALALPAASVRGPERASLLFAAGALATLQGRVDEGRERLTEARTLAHELSDPRLGAYASNYEAMGYAQRRDPGGAEAAARALAWFRENDDPYGLRLALLMSALFAQFQGDGPAADRLSEEAVQVARTLGQDRDLAIALQSWSLLWAVRGRYDRAEPLAVESLAALRQDPSYLFVARGLDFLGEVAGVRGEPLRAARLLGLAAALRRSIGAEPFAIDAARLEARIPGFREGAGVQRFDAAWTEGEALSWEAVVDEITGAAPEGKGGREAAAMAVPTGSASPSLSPPAPLVPPGAVSPPSDGRGRLAPSAPVTTPLARAALRIRTLGGFAVETETDPPESGSWAYARPRELLVLLLLHPRGCTRSEIGEAIWPEATAPQVKNSFHVTLHHLRKRLGDPGWIRLEEDRYVLSRERGVEWDAERFEAAIRAGLALDRAHADRDRAHSRGAGAGRGGEGEVEEGAVEAGRPEGQPSDPATVLRNALALYGGDLLEGMGSGRWLEDARDRYRRLHVDGWMALGRALVAAGDDHAALEAWQEVIRRETLHEEAHRALMRSWARLGNRERALRHYHQLTVLLREGLEAEPERETLRLYQELIEGTGPG